MFDYILSTEAINSKGFVVLTEGIELEKFQKNPVALFNHNIDKVVGTWINVRINENNKEELIGTLIFDDDDESLVLKKKVSKNLIKHVSVGLRILEFYEDFIGGKDIIVITKSELKEVSITPLPANDQAIKLNFDNESVENIEFFINKNNNNMENKLVTLTTEIDSLKEDLKTLSEDSAVKISEIENEKTEIEKDLKLKDEEILDLNAKITELSSKLDEIELAKEVAKFNDLLDEAIEIGKIKDEQKETFLKLTYENAKSIIDGLESKVIKPEIKLSDKVITKTDGKKDYRWYEINDPKALELMYKENREKHDKLEKEYYG